MTTRIDPLVAEFISSIRKLPAIEREIKILNERRRIITSNSYEPNVKHSNILKLIYMRMLGYEIDEIYFLNACESSTLRIKTAGYLGMISTENDYHTIIMINTIMKDLSKKNSRNDALTAVCNLRDDNAVLSELSQHVYPNWKTDTFHKKGLVAFYKMNPDAKMRVVCHDPFEVYVKAQILVDTFHRTNSINLTENDVSFLSFLFVKNRHPLLRVKLLQIFKIFYLKAGQTLDKDFVDSIESVIIPAKDKVRSQAEVALSIEAVEFLLEIGKHTPRIEGFVFRLIESKNPNSRYFGFKIVNKHKVHRDIAIDRCIKTGLHNEMNLRTLISLMNKNNHKAIYKRREEIIFYMEKEGVKRWTVDAALIALLSKIIQHAKDDLLIKIYHETPEVSLNVPFDKNIPKEHTVKLLDNVSQTTDCRYFPLIYQLLQSGRKNDDFYCSIFEKHLNILSRRSTNREEGTLEMLFNCMLSVGSPERNRDILISRYVTMIRRNLSCLDMLDQILNTIYLLNARSEDRAINILGPYFLYFSADTRKDRAMFKFSADVQIVALLGDGAELKKIQENSIDTMISSVYSMENSKKLSVNTSVGGDIKIINIEVFLMKA